MLQENLIKIYEKSFRENREMSALTDYFKNETFSYYEMAKEIAKLHLVFKKAGIKRGDKIALIGRNNPRWCITYIGTITYGAVIVPILQDFIPADVIHIINHSESRLLFLGDNFWDVIEEDQIRQIEAVFSLTDFHVIYERDGKSLTKFQRDILKNYRSKYPRGFSINDIKYPEVPNDPSRAGARSRSCRWPTPTAAPSTSSRRWPSADPSRCSDASPRRRSCSKRWPSSSPR